MVNKGRRVNELCSESVPFSSHKLRIIAGGNDTIREESRHYKFCA